MTFLMSKIQAMNEKILSWKKGKVFIFAVLKRTDLDDKWDILISADWIKKSNDQRDLIQVIKLLRSEFASDLDFLSKIVLLQKEESIIIDIAKAINRYSLESGYVGELRVTEKFIIGEIHLVHIDLEGLDLSEKTIVEKIPEAKGF